MGSPGLRAPLGGMALSWTVHIATQISFPVNVDMFEM
jgi:hypothetical protein